MSAEIVRGDPIVVRGESGFEEAAHAVAHESPGRLLIGLSGVSSMGSLGLRAIIDAHQRVLGADGRTAVVVVYPNAQGIFHVLRADGLPDFLMCDSIEAAESALSAP